jgi:hypothetical protein
MASAELTAIRIEFESVEAFEKEIEQNLRNGGAMAHGALEAVEGQIRKVVIVHPGDGRELELEGSVVWVGEQGGARAVGLAFVGFDPDMRKRIVEFAAVHEEPAPKEKDGSKRVHERLRGLTVAEQIKVAREGEVVERMVLERIYGKGVWEPLLRNPRLTMPEVSRIAHMGNLPVPLVELIVSNGAWLASPMVRRGLLSNPRLGADAIAKVLRAMPQGELKLVPKQTAYTAQVREAARRILHG